MDTSRVEELLEQLISQNQEVAETLRNIHREIERTNNELDWVREHSFAKMVTDGIQSLETSIQSLPQ